MCIYIYTYAKDTTRKSMFLHRMNTSGWSHHLHPPFGRLDLKLHLRHGLLDSRRSTKIQTPWGTWPSSAHMNSDESMNFNDIKCGVINDGHTVTLALDG